MHGRSADPKHESLLSYCRGEVSDYVMMEGRGFGFATFKDPSSAQRFLDVRLPAFNDAWDASLQRF